MDDLGKINNPVVTTGTFDGVHAGHHVIINRLIQRAREIGGESVLITFHPHPRRILYPEAQGKNLLLINSQEEKKELLSKTGLDHLIILEFTRDFAATSCSEFVEQYLVGRLHSKIIVVGFNHYFGKNKRGDFEYLYRLQEKYSFRVEEIPHHDIQNETVSSTKIRSALTEGNIQRANAYLEHHYRIMAVLFANDDDHDQTGKEVYDVNINERIKLIPADGMYAVSVHVRNTMHKALFLVEDGGVENNMLASALKMKTVPLEQTGGLDRSKVTICFHKRIGSPVRSRNNIRESKILEKGLRDIEELIY